jgi:hypothetical protein
MGRIERHVMDRLQDRREGISVVIRGGAAGDDNTYDWDRPLTQRPLPDWAMHRGWASGYELAYSLKEAEPTRAQRLSVDRSIRKLVAGGLVESDRSSLRWLRLPVSQEQLDAEHGEAMEARKRMSSMR